MNTNNKISQDNLLNEIKYDEFMDNAYQQINNDITKVLFEMKKEKQNLNKNDNNFNHNSFEDKLDVNNEINNNLIPNINSNISCLQKNNYSNNDLCINNNLLKFNNEISNNVNKYPINIFNYNSSFYNINIIYNNNDNKSFSNPTVSEPYNTRLYNEDIPENIINISNIKRNEDKRTTVIIKNIPNKYTIQLLLIELNVNFANKFDVIYLPQDKINNCNLGYGFINFINPLYLITFYETFMGKKWNFFNSKKRCFLAYSNYQGKDELINYLFKKLKIKQFNNHKLSEKVKKSVYISCIKNEKGPKHFYKASNVI